MKKVLLTILLVVILLTPLSLSGQGGFTLVAGAVDTNSAQSGLNQTADKAGLISDTSPVVLIGNIIQIVLGFLGVIFLILLIYGGFLRMTAKGEAGKIEASTGIITSAIVGVFIILTSYIITSFVFKQIEDSINSTGGNDNTQVLDCTPACTYPDTCVDGVCKDPDAL